MCISPGQTTAFSFDSQLAPGSVSVEEAERFTKVEPGPSTLKLVPSEKVPIGRQLRVTVRFADGAAPSSAAFVLVAHAAQSASLVEVHPSVSSRRSRSCWYRRDQVTGKSNRWRQRSSMQLGELWDRVVSRLLGNRLEYSGWDGRLPYPSGGA